MAQQRQQRWRHYLIRPWGTDGVVRILTTGARDAAREYLTRGVDPAPTPGLYCVQLALDAPGPLPTRWYAIEVTL